jgi:hypothetical protein
MPPPAHRNRACHPDRPDNGGRESQIRCSRIRCRSWVAHIAHAKYVSRGRFRDGRFCEQPLLVRVQVANVLASGRHVIHSERIARGVAAIKQRSSRSGRPHGRPISRWSLGSPSSLPWRGGLATSWGCVIRRHRHSPSSSTSTTRRSSAACLRGAASLPTGIPARPVQSLRFKSRPAGRIRRT